MKVNPLSEILTRILHVFKNFRFERLRKKMVKKLLNYQCYTLTVTKADINWEVIVAHDIIDGVYNLQPVFQ